MIASLLKTGDERRKLMVWKASTFTLIVVVLGFMGDIITSIIKTDAMLFDPFVRLSVIAITYFLTLLYYKKKYGN